jgi:hypothetical protein
MAIGPGTNESNALVVAPECLAVIEQRLGVVEDEWNQSAPRDSVLLLAKQSVAADESAGLVEFDREAQPGLEDEADRRIEASPMHSVARLGLPRVGLGWRDEGSIRP